MDNNKINMNSETITYINGGLKAEQISSPQVAEPGNPPSFTDISANQYHGTDGQPVDNNVVGKTSFPEIKVQPTSDAEMNDVLGPVFAEANKQVARLQKEIEENKSDPELSLRNQKIIEMYKPVVDAGQKWSAYYTEQQNRQAEIEAKQMEEKKLIADAEAEIGSVDADGKNLEAVIAKVEGIIRSLNIEAALNLWSKLQDLKIRKMATV